tara:strand:- start:93 stop:362 length:270 start_codon:yes stop_codon:yes gene_type:complete
MLGIGTLFRYKYAKASQHTMRYGVVTERFDSDMGPQARGSVMIRWMHGGEPYTVMENDLIAMIKSGGPGSAILYNPATVSGEHLTNTFN